MDFLKKLLNQFKAHWEKVLLGLALVGLILAVMLLSGRKESEAEKIRDYTKQIERTRTKDLPPANLAAAEQAIAEGTNIPALAFAPPHKLVNPVKWQRKPDGSLLKIETGSEVGPEALKVTKITPLNLLVTLDKATSTGYMISVTREADARPPYRVKLQSYLNVGRPDRLNTFTLREVRGEPGDPSELILELTEGGDRISLSKDKPVLRVEGYKADLVYPPQNRTLPEKRVGDVITLEGEEYNIVAITPTQVLVSARSNNKRTTISL